MTDFADEEQSRIGEYLASHGGPFFELQRRLGLLKEEALLAERRAVLYVALAWGIPLILSLAAGRAFGAAESHPYLLDFGAMARFLVAIGLFVLAEQQVESGLRGKLGQLVRAPILAPNSFAEAARAVAKSLRLRDSGAAEIVCLVLAIMLDLGGLGRLLGADDFELGGARCRRPRASDAGRLVGRGREPAALLFPAAQGPVALSRLGVAPVPARLA